METAYVTLAMKLERKDKRNASYHYFYDSRKHLLKRKLFVFAGDSTGLDICSIHSNATLLRYYSSVISYGFLGDVVRDSEKFRWMGPKRYEFSGNYNCT
jgi:hypothetical protein